MSFDNNPNIQEERINNPDGSYTIKSILKRDNGMENSSFIEYFDKDGKYLKGEYFIDDNFQNLSVEQRIEYSDDGNITVYKVYGDPYQGTGSSIETFDKDKAPIANYKYANKDFTDLLSSEIRDYEEDGSYSLNATYIYSEYNGKSVCTEKVDSNGIILEEIQNLTKNGKYFGKITTRYDAEEKRYYQNTSLVEADNEGLKSYKKIYDKYNRLILGQYFKTSNYKKIDSVYSAEYNEDNSYVARFVYHNFLNGWGSIEETYGSDDEYLSSRGFYDKNFRKLGWSESRTVNEDGGYTSSISYTNPNHNGNSQQLTYDSKGNFVLGKYYSDKNFECLLKTIRVEYNDDGTFYKYVIYEEGGSDEFLPAKRLFDSKGREIKRELYEDRIFSKLLYQEEYVYKDSGTSDYLEGSNSDKTLFTKGKFSTLSLTHNCFIDSRYAYLDEDCKDLFRRELYFLPLGRKGDVIKLTEYYKKQPDNYGAVLEYFNMQHKMIYHKKFKNKLVAEFLAATADPLVWMVLFIYSFLLIYVIIHTFMQVAD